MKKIGRADIIGERGMAHIRKVVLSMGFMFYETGGVEAGIDGFIELRDEATGEVSNLILQVQGKATDRERLQAETETSFEFPVSEADIAYWRQGTAPVLLIVVRPELEKAYWKSVKDWFVDPDRLKARKIIFDKEKDEFVREAKAGILEVATSTSPGASGPSVRKQETLLVNLLRVRVAPTIYWAPTDYKTDKAFGAALRERDLKAPSEWIVRGGGVISFNDLDRWPWNELCDSGAIEEFGSEEWSESEDDDRQRDFVALLNRALGEFVRPELWKDRETGYYYFSKPRNRNTLRFKYKSLKNETSRAVVGPYGKRREGNEPSYFRHSAFGSHFVRVAGQWYLEVTPTYHFTRDGRAEDKFAGEHLKKIKELENNAAVLGQFVTWRHFLTDYKQENLYGLYPFLSFEPVHEFQLDVGVPDELWKARESDPSSPLFDYSQLDEVLTS